jgi:hypothetical protein
MSRGPYKRPEAASLKEAVADLVKACGGLEKVSAIIEDRLQRKLSTTQIARYYDKELPQTAMPVDIVRLLEGACGQNIVTGFIAMDTGAVIVPVQRDHSRQECLQHLSSVLRETGSLSSEACANLADGQLSPAEQAQLRVSAMKTISALAGLLGDLKDGDDG